MKRKNFYSALAVVAAVWLGLDAAIRAQQGGPGSTGTANQGSSSSDGSQGTPNVPGSGPIAPIDRTSPSNPSPVEAGQSNGGGRKASGIDPAVVDRVRSAITNDPSLVGFIQNVEVSEAKGKVRLSGRVGTRQERNMIAARASEIVGGEKVDNQIIVADQGR